MKGPQVNSICMLKIEESYEGIVGGGFPNNSFPGIHVIFSTLGKDSWFFNGVESYPKHGPIGLAKSKHKTKKA